MRSLKWHELGQTREEIAQAFWRLSGLPETYPRDIFTACIWTLPAGIIWVPGLTGSTVAAHFPSGRHAGLLEQYAVSPLYGCLVASRGAAIIFIEKNLPKEEASFTIAHEISHFLVDYLIPRDRALSKMGERIRPVLDGERPPDLEERVDALLCGIPLGAYVNATPGGPRLFSEDSADMLALELLAPANRVLQEVPEKRVLVSRYGLPPDVAGWYADYIKTRSAPGGRYGGFREWLEGPSSVNQRGGRGEGA